MERVQAHLKITNRVKIFYALLTALGLLVIAGLDWYEQKNHFTEIAATFALLLIGYAGYLAWLRSARPTAIPEMLLVGLLLTFTLLLMERDASVAHWVYMVPIYTFFLVPFRWANIFLVLYSIGFLTQIVGEFALEVRHQIVLTYLSSYVFSFAFALVNHRNGSHFSKIINTDPITQVYNQHQLKHDLNKEIVRADRQHSQLYFLVASLPSDWQDLKSELYEHRLGLVGERLRRCLRQSDTCYRLDNDNFVILMPQTNQQDAEQVQQLLSRELADFRGANVSIEPYRYEDDVDSLLNKMVQVGELHEG